MKIGNTYIDEKHPHITGCKSLEDVQRLEIFVNDADNMELWEAIKPKEVCNSEWVDMQREEPTAFAD